MDNINNWLNGITSKYSNITNKEYIQSIFSILYGWLKTNHRLYLNYTPDDLLIFLNYVTYFYEDDNLNDEEEFTYLDENIM